jgi:hypothetical protein
LIVSKGFVLSTHLAQEKLGWVWSKEEEEDLKGEVG